MDVSSRGRTVYSKDAPQPLCDRSPAPLLGQFHHLSLGRSPQQLFRIHAHVAGGALPGPREPSGLCNATAQA